MSYLYNFSKPVVQYTSNKVAEGAKYLYNKISGNNNSDESGINIISLQRDDEVQKSSLIFEKANDVDEEEEEEKEEKDENKNIETQEFPSLSTINLVADNNENQNIDSNDNSAPIEIKLSTSDEKNEE